MSILRVSKLRKNYFNEDVLSELSFTLERGERLAIVGDNGAGKSTLFRILTGKEKADGGRFAFASGLVVACLSQQMEELDDLSQSSLDDSRGRALDAELRQSAQVLAELADRAAAEGGADEGYRRALREYDRLADEFARYDGDARRANIAAILSGLGLQGDVLDRPLATLSGGERMRVALARILESRPDVLLLDEPTNHLDIRAIEWLEDYLKRYAGTLMFISHDRAFIDRVADRVGELLNGRLYLYKGNFSQFMEQRRIAQDFIAKESARLKKEMEYEAKVAQTMLSHRKMASYHAREKRVAKLAERLARTKERRLAARGRMHFKYISEGFSGDPKRQIIRAQDLLRRFPDKTLFSELSFELRANEKIVCVGPNGCGKSSLMRLLTGEDEADGGELWLSPSVTAAHMGQYCDFADESATLLDEIMGCAELSEGEARNLLAAYGFTGNDVFKEIAVLSGGERSRLYLCALLLEKPDLLFLDEPTNHLDLNSKDILEKALAAFPGAIFGISHDRYFIERVADRVLGFDGGSARCYENYAQYRRALLRAAERRREEKSAAGPAQPEAAAPSAAADLGASADARSVGKPPAPAAKNRAQLRREKAQRMQSLSAREKAIAALEAEKAALEARFADADGAAYARYAELLKEIDRLSDLYLEEALELENFGEG